MNHLIKLLLLVLATSTYGKTVPAHSDDAQRRAAILTQVKEFEPKFNVPQIEAQKALGLLDSKNHVFVDVRSAAERQVSTIKGALSREEFEKQASQLKDKQIVTYCTIGYRSSAFAQDLIKRGFKASNMRGSILMWAHEGGTFVDKKGQETKAAHVYGPAWDLLPLGYQGTYSASSP